MTRIQRAKQDAKRNEIVAVDAETLLALLRQADYAAQERGNSTCDCETCAQAVVDVAFLNAETKG